MANEERLENRVRERRTRRGWSQDDLARRTGLSRAGISAIETYRLIPSAAAALSLAEAFGCRVEELFRLKRSSAAPVCLWPPIREPWRVWEIELGGSLRLVPTEPTAAGLIPHDGILSGGVYERREDADAAPERTLLIGTCDPAIGILSTALWRDHGVRLIPLPRPSKRSLGLLGDSMIHAAGIHLADTSNPEGNAGVVRRELGDGFRLIPVAHWEEGVAISSSLRLPTIRQTLRSDLHWIGREAGSGARQCLDELLADRPAPTRFASDHRGVAEAIRQGWGDAGVCLRLVAEEAGLDFLSVREETYDLVVPADLMEDERIEALLSVLKSHRYRQSISALPGYRVSAEQ